MKHLSACLSYSKRVFNDIISIEIYGHGDVYFYNMLNMYDNNWGKENIEYQINDKNARILKSEEQREVTW